MVLRVVSTVDVANVNAPSRIVLLRDGFGTVSITMELDDELHDDYRGILLSLSILLNSKAFVEFLCSMRHFIFLSNSAKRCFFTTVLSSVLRGIPSVSLMTVDAALASTAYPPVYNCAKFVRYVLKWIPALRNRTVQVDAFLSSYMQCISKELDDMNRFAFRAWCGHAFPFSSSQDCSYTVYRSFCSPTTQESVSVSRFGARGRTPLPAIAVLPSPPTLFEGVRNLQRALRPSCVCPFISSRTQCRSGVVLFLCASLNHSLFICAALSFFRCVVCPSPLLYTGEWGVLLHSHRDILCERRVGGDEEAVSNEMEPKAAREDL